MTISYTDKTKLAIVEDGNTAWGEAIRENFRILELILKGYQFAERKEGHINLSFAYYGGNMAINGEIVTVPDGSVTLPDNVTSYIEADAAGTITANQQGFTAGRVALFEVTTATGAIGTVTDRRTWTHGVDFTEINQRIDAAAGATSALAENTAGHIEGAGAVSFGYHSGTIAVGGTVGTIAAGTIAIVDDATNYIEAGFAADGTPSVFTNTTGFTEVERIPLHIVTTTTGVITEVKDNRPYLFTNKKGVDTFIGLLDTPATFGTAGQVVKVNGTGDGLVFADDIDTTDTNATSIQGATVPAPTATENGKVMAYDSGTDAMIWIEMSVNSVDVSNDAITPENMTSNTSPAPYVAASNGEDLAKEAYKAFDGDPATRWQSANGDVGDKILSIDLGNQLLSHSYVLDPNDSYPISDWRFEGSNDNASWTILDSRNGQNLSASTEFIMSPEPTTKYRYYRLVVTGVVSTTNNWVAIQTFIINGPSKVGNIITVQQDGSFGDSGQKIDDNAKKIHSIPITAPAAADDGKVLAYDDANQLYKWIDGGGGSAELETRVTNIEEEITITPTEYTVISAFSTTTNIESNSWFGYDVQANAAGEIKKIDYQFYYVTANPTIQIWEIETQTKIFELALSGLTAETLYTHTLTTPVLVKSGRTYAIGYRQGGLNSPRYAGTSALDTTNSNFTYLRGRKGANDGNFPTATETNRWYGMVNPILSEDSLKQRVVKLEQDKNAEKIQAIPVDVTGLEDGYVLTYDAALNKFVGKVKTSGGGGFVSLGASQSTVDLNINITNTTIMA